MADTSKLKEVASTAINETKEDLKIRCEFIHSNPNVSYEDEAKAHHVLIEFLQKQLSDQVKVQTGVFGENASFTCSFGSGSPKVAIISEYDIDKGNSRGHQLVAVSGVAAFIGVVAALKKGRQSSKSKKGTITLVGSPAEAGGAAKISMMKKGAFKGYDAALMVHPANEDTVNAAFYALTKVSVKYHGKGSIASVPTEGINALDALIQAYNSLTSLKKKFPPTVKLAGVITHGGIKPTIIPELAEATFSLWAKDGKLLEDTKKKIDTCFEEAAKSSGCTVEIDWDQYNIESVFTNEPLAQAFIDNMKRLSPDKKLSLKSSEIGVSTDFGNVSHAVPGIHPCFKISQHHPYTPEFEQDSTSDQAQEETFLNSICLAHTALDIFFNGELRKKAWEFFQENLDVQ